MSEVNLKNTRFGKILTRTNKDIRDDRALNIMEEAELEYKREVENMDRDLKILKRKRDAMLDLSPGNSYQLNPEKFDAARFVKEDIELGVQIRNLEIKLEIGQKKYNELFTEPEAVDSK